MYLYFSNSTFYFYISTSTFLSILATPVWEVTILFLNCSVVKSCSVIPTLRKCQNEQIALFIFHNETQSSPKLQGSNLLSKSQSTARYFKKQVFVKNIHLYSAWEIQKYRKLLINFDAQIDILSQLLACWPSSKCKSVTFACGWLCNSNI